MTQSALRAAALLILSTVLATGASAQIYSVNAGGPWSDGATWQGGVVPTQNNHAIIRGTVNMNGNLTIGSVTVEQGATLQIQPGGDRTLTVNGNLTNNGTVRDRQDGNWWMYLRIGGDVTNNGVWANYRTTLIGSANQTMSHASGSTFTSPLISEKDAGIISAASNLSFSSSFSMNEDTLQMNGWTLSFDGEGYIDQGIIHTNGVLSQTNVFRSALERTRLIGTTTIEGRVNLGANNVFEGTLVVSDTLQNRLSCDCTNYVEGDVINNGTIRDITSGNWWNYLRIHGNITNNGVWTNYRTYLIGTGDQSISQGAGATFGGPLESLKESGTIRAGSDLDFSNLVDFNDDPMDMGPYGITLRGNGYLNDGLLSMNGFLAQYDSERSAVERSRIVGTTTIRGTVNLGNNNVFEGTLIVADTLQNRVSCDCTNYVEGDVINNGTIRDVPVRNWWNYLRIHGDMTNNGTWANYRTYLVGTGDQTISQSDGSTFEGYIESLKESGFIRGGSDLDFANIFDLNTDSLYTSTHGITVRGNGYLNDGSVFMDAYLRQTESANRAINAMRFIGTTRIRETVNLGGNNRFAGTLVVEDTLQNVMSCDCWATVEGHLINEGTIRNVVSNWWLYLNFQGSITNRGTWTNRYNYLNGDGMRTWDAPGVSAPFTMNGGNITLTGDNVMSNFAVSAPKGPHVASGATFQVPPGSSDSITNAGQVYVLEDVSGGGTYGLYQSDFRVAAGAFDSLQVSHFGNQAPYSFSNAVRSYWSVRTVPENAPGTIEWMEFGYLDDELGTNTEDQLHVYHSADNGQTWTQVSSEGSMERYPDANYLKVYTLPSNGVFALSSDPDMITILPSLITSVIGRDQIRLGPPNRYTIHYANNSDVPTGDMMMMLHVNRNIHINHIEPSGPDGVNVDWLYPEDFAIYGDSTVAPPDTVAFLILQSMAPGEERSFDVVLDAYPDDYNPGKFVFVPAIGVVVWWAATGIATSYVTDMTFNVLEESFARTDGAGPVISEAFRKTNQKWFSFEKPASELAKDLALTWGQGIIGGTLGTAAVVAVKVGEGFFNFMKAIACGSDRYLNGKQTLSACQDKPVEKVTSWDPNEKIGPTGYGDAGYVTDASRVTYQILFENKAEAGAPAWKIAIDDTLSAAFDASTARFEGASHEGFSFTVDGQALHWEIEGIELQPNVNPPEGEGFVLFSVDTVPGLASGTQLENRAVIVFDYNPPIMTNTFVNTLDFQAPTTSMEPLPTEVSGGPLTVRWSATDASGASGVQSTNLFMSVDGGAFVSVGSTFADSMMVDVEPFHDYRFYALSKDHVGNAETVRPTLSTTSVISGVANETGEQPWTFALEAAYPNPFNPVTTIRYVLPEHGPVQLVVFDALGRRVSTLVQNDQLPGQHSVRWDAGTMASGVYFYQLTQGRHTDTRPMILLK